MSKPRLLPTEASRRFAAVFTVGIFSFIAAAAVGLSTQIARPMVHDEFSYLLAADTFARGRLANPTHPLAPSFATFHVLESPTYASKYPPAQGFFLMLGQRSAGAAILGVWVAAALSSAAIVWMLLAFVPVRWAVLGGLLAAAHFGTVGAWAHSYWGGAVAALAGALALGAVARVTRYRRPRDAVVLAFGILLLANSRPYEGFLLSLPIAAVLARDALRRHAPPTFSRHVVLPALLVLVLGFVWMGYYNARVTHDPLKLPYTLYEERTPFPTFTFQSHRSEPEYRNARMRQQHVEFIQGFFDEPRAVPWLAPGIVEGRLLPSWRFYVGWIWTLPLLAIPFALRQRGTALLLACVAIELTGSLVTNWSMRHYLAPMTGAVVGLVVLGLRRLDAVRAANTPVGRIAVIAVVVLSFVVALTRVDEHVQSDLMWNRQRAGLIEILSRTAHDHLILVEYHEDYPVVAEWVFNSAEIDSQPVVWARSLDPAADRALVRYFPDRQVWRLRFEGGAILVAHPLGDDRGPFAYDRVTIPWEPRDGLDAFFPDPAREPRRAPGSRSR